MATLNLTLDKRRIKVDRTYPIVFKLNCNRKQAIIKTGISVNEQFFNQENGFISNSDMINNELQKLDHKYRERLMKYLILNHGSENISELKKDI